MTRNDEPPPDRLLTVDAAADRLSTSSRFIRRLIAERRIEFVKVGRYVRISESALRDFIAAGRVEPMTAVDTHHKFRGAALCRTGKDIDVSATLGNGNLAVSRSAIQGRMAVCVPAPTHMSAKVTLKERSPSSRLR
jgi:excisionase family DNA binding protein